MTDGRQYRLEDAPIPDRVESWERPPADSRAPKPPAFPYLSRLEGFVWWWDADARGGGRRAYHHGQIPTAPEYAYLWPYARWGTPEEALEAGYDECDACSACQDAIERRKRPSSRWQRGGHVRRG
jgi:hypothetical protein